MQLATDRRSPSTTRIPLDGVQIKLTPVGLTDHFDADGVDIGAGGLSLRSAMIPDIGSVIRCTFETPSGAPVDGECEVVWASEEGDSCGEFGLRFVTLEPRARAALQTMVDDWEEMFVSAPSAKLLPSSVVSLEIEGVKPRISAEVAYQDEAALIVEQPLPFLRLGSKLKTGEGHEGELASADLRVGDDGVPRLVLTVNYANGTTESTLHDASGSGPREIVAKDAPIETPHVSESGNAEPLQRSTAEPPPLPSKRRDAVRLFRTRKDAKRLEPSDLDAELDAELDRLTGSVLTNRLRAAGRSVRPAVGAVRGKLSAVLAKLLPALMVGIAHIRAALAKAKERGRPAIGSAWTSTKVFFSALRNKASGDKPERTKPKRTQKRRSTSPAPRRRRGNVDETMRTRGSETEAVSPEKRRRRTIALSAIMFLGVGGIAYALTAGDNASADVAPPGDTPVAAEPVAAVAPVAQPVAQPIAQPIAQPVAQPQPVAQAAQPVAQATQPGAAPGQIPAPVFPQLGQRPPTPGSLPTGSPYAVEAAPAAPPAGQVGHAPGQPIAPPVAMIPQPTVAPVAAVTPEAPRTVRGRTFGVAEVRNGRTFVLQMSRPVNILEATREENGFTVKVPGALSLDRAGPIARAHSKVSRSAIFNRGDHAELTIEFAEGESPDYRVRARGRSIELVIGR